MKRNHILCMRLTKNKKKISKQRRCVKVEWWGTDRQSGKEKGGGYYLPVYKLVYCTFTYSMPDIVCVCVCLSAVAFGQLCKVAH